MPQIAKLKEVDILVDTPGRLFDLVSQRFIKLRSVEILILDEADHMLDMGFYKDIKELTTYLPQQRQTIFSATINDILKIWLIPWLKCHSYSNIAQRSGSVKKH